MKLKRHLMTLTATALAAVGWSAVLGAHEKDHGFDHHGPRAGFAGVVGGPFQERMMKRVFDELDLAPEQEQTVEEILGAARPRLEELRLELRTQRNRLHDTGPDAADYAAVVTDAGRRIGDLVTQLIEIRSQMRAEVHGVLTEEQRREAERLRTEMRNRMERRMANRQP